MVSLLINMLVNGLALTAEMDGTVDRLASVLGDVGTSKATASLARLDLMRLNEESQSRRKRVAERGGALSCISAREREAYQVEIAEKGMSV